MKREQCTLCGFKVEHEHRAYPMYLKPPLTLSHVPPLWHTTCFYKPIGFNF